MTRSVPIPQLTNRTAVTVCVVALNEPKPSKIRAINSFK